RRGLRQRAEHYGSRYLETGEVLAAESDDFFRCGWCFGLEGHKGAGGFAPHRVGAGDDGGFEHAGMPVEDVFDLDRRDVLAARNDDVLRAVLQLDIAVGMHDPEIARMEPPARKGLLGGARILQIPLHDDIAAHQDLAYRRAIG